MLSQAAEGEHPIQESHDGMGVFVRLGVSFGEIGSDGVLQFPRHARADLSLTARATSMGKRSTTYVFPSAAVVAAFATTDPSPYLNKIGKNQVLLPLCRGCSRRSHTLPAEPHAQGFLAYALV